MAPAARRVLGVAALAALGLAGGRPEGTVLGVLAAPAAHAQEKAPPQRPAPRTPQPVVVVQGEAELKAAPDRAFVTLAVESRDKDARAAQRRNAAVMSAVQEKLAAAGLPPDVLRTLAYDLDLEVDYEHGKRVPRGYRARNTIEVRLDTVDRVGEVIDLAVAAGANEVSGVRFDLKDRSGLEREALRLAVANARASADAAAAGAGGAIESVQRVEQQGAVTELPRPLAMEMRMASAEAAPPPTAIRAGEITVRARVTLTAKLR